MFIPVFISIFRFTTGDSVPVSKITILSGAFTTFMTIFADRHHIDQNKLLVNYPLATVLVPAALGGTQMGVLVTQLLPTSVVGVLLVVFIVYSFRKLVDK